MDFISENEIRQVMQEVIDRFLLPNFESKGMEATGEWRRNLEAKVEPEAGVIRGRKYTRQLVNGRQPGKYVPIEPLKKWAMAKFGADEKRATSIAYAVSEKIKQRGTTWYEQGGTDLIERLEKQDVVDYIEDRLGQIAKVNAVAKVKRDLKEVLR